jgi:hypothetical protein
MFKFIFFCLFCFPPSSFCQPVIQYGDSVTIDSASEVFYDGQMALDMDKNTYLMLRFPNPDYESLNEVLDSLKSDGVSLISNPNGDTLSIPPDNYVDSLQMCLGTLEYVNEQIIKELGLK